jgi:predicted ester cyclase
LALGIKQIHIYRVDDGKLQEEWENWDTLGLMRQLGVIPQPGAATR